MASTGTMVLGSVCKQNPMWYCNSPEQNEFPKKAQKTDLIQYWPLQGSYCHRAGFTSSGQGTLCVQDLQTPAPSKRHEEGYQSWGSLLSLQSREPCGIVTAQLN